MTPSTWAAGMQSVFDFSGGAHAPSSDPPHTSSNRAAFVCPADEINLRTMSQKICHLIRKYRASPSEKVKETRLSKIEVSVIDGLTGILFYFRETLVRFDPYRTDRVSAGVTKQE